MIWKPKLETWTLVCENRYAVFIKRVHVSESERWSSSFVLFTAICLWLDTWDFSGLGTQKIQMLEDSDVTGTQADSDTVTPLGSWMVVCMYSSEGQTLRVSSGTFYIWGGGCALGRGKEVNTEENGRRVKANSRTQECDRENVKMAGPLGR